MKSLPFFPPRLFEDDRRAILDIIREVGADPSQEFVAGAGAARLEDAVRAINGARYSFACGSGSAAIAVALGAMGVGRGDEVIVPAFGCQPVVDSVVNIGAVPVFADVEPHTFVLDPDAAAAAVGPRTSALLPAHMFSVMADMPALRSLAEGCGLKILEDAATALGAELNGVPAGRWGDAAVLSFSQFKPLGGIGEGGLVLTDDPDIARTLPEAHSVGMDEIVARVVLLRLPQLAARLDRKMEIAARYSDALRILADKGLLQLPPEAPFGRRFHVYAVLTEERDHLREHLRRRGVTTHVYYPVPLPRQPAFTVYAKGAFPHAEAVGRTNLALPVWPGMTDRDVEYVADAVLDYFVGRH